MKSSLFKSFKSILIMLGVLSVPGVLLTLWLTDWYNRPKIAISPVKLTILHEINEGWKVEYISKIYNNGNSKGLVNSMDLFLLFNSDEERPYRITKNISFTIEGRSHVVDTCKGILPKDLKVSNDLLLKKISCLLYKNNQKKWFEGDFQQKELKLFVTPRLDQYNPADLPFARFDEEKGFINYAIRWHDIHYKGMTNQIAIYPPNAEMEYKIESDSIYLSIATPIADSSVVFEDGEYSGQFVAPLVWADVDIRKFLVIPNYIDLGFEKTTKGASEITSEEHYYELGEIGEFDYWVVYTF